MNSQKDLDRMFYVELRESSGCPPVVSRKYSNGKYFVEVKDGSVFIEELSASSAWDAKSQCIIKWTEETINER